MDINFVHFECVWAKFTSTSKLFWPALIVPESASDLDTPTGKILVYWFGDHRKSLILKKYVSKYAENFSKNYNRKVKPKKWTKGVLESLKVIFSEDLENLTDDVLLINWATRRFSDPDVNCVLDYLPNHISEFLKVEVSKSDEFFSRNIPKSRDLLKKTIEDKDQLRTICSCCFSKKGIKNHPITEGKICETCLEKLKNTLYVMDRPSDEKHYAYCFLCGNINKNMKKCKIANCHRSFCLDCNKIMMKSKNEVNEAIKCFVCERKDYPSILGLRDNYNYHIQQLLSGDIQRRKYKAWILEKSLNSIVVFNGKCEALKYIYAHNRKQMFIPKIEDSNGVLLGSSPFKDVIYEYNFPIVIDGNSGKVQPKLIKYEEWQTEFEDNYKQILVGGISSTTNIQKEVEDNPNLMIFYNFYKYYNLLKSKKERWLLQMPYNLDFQIRSMISRFMYTKPIFLETEENSFLVWTNILEVLDEG